MQVSYKAMNSADTRWVLDPSCMTLAHAGALLGGGKRAARMVWGSPCIPVRLFNPPATPQGGRELRRQGDGGCAGRVLYCSLARLITSPLTLAGGGRVGGKSESGLLPVDFQPLGGADGQP
jgi:hypothetical protein